MLTITGLMDEKPMMIWAAHYLSAMAKALMDEHRANQWRLNSSCRSRQISCTKGSVTP